jgi:hypothetical protein
VRADAGWELRRSERYANNGERTLGIHDYSAGTQRRKASGTATHGAGVQRGVRLPKTQLPTSRLQHFPLPCIFSLIPRDSRRLTGVEGVPVDLDVSAVTLVFEARLQRF